MAIYRHTQQQVNEYYDSVGINQSALKVLISEGIESFLIKRDDLQRQSDLYYEEKEHFIIGSAVDVFLTQGEEEYYRQYAVSKMPKKPGEKPMSIIRRLFDKVVINKEPYQADYGENTVIPAELRPLIFFKKDLYDICNEHQFYMNQKVPKDEPVKEKVSKGEIQRYIADPRTWKDDNRVNAYLSNPLCEQYWTELIGSIGKQILDDEQSSLISTILMSFKTHKHTAFLFKEEPGVDVIYQLALHFDLDDVMCKVMLDMLIVDHNNGRLIPVDDKTTGRLITRFPREIRYRRYDIQGALYSKGVDLCRNHISNIVSRDVSHYEIAPFAFVVSSTTKPGIPLIYVLDHEILIEGEHGNPEEDLLGYRQGLQLYKEWQAIDFSVERKYESTNGVVVLHKGYHKTMI